MQDVSERQITYHRVFLFFISLSSVSNAYTCLFPGNDGASGPTCLGEKSHIRSLDLHYSGFKYMSASRTLVIHQQVRPMLESYAAETMNSILCVL